MLSNIWVWDPGSEIRDPGVKKTPDPGSGSATLAPGFIFKFFYFNFVNPHAAILKRRRGDCRHQQHGGV